MIGISPDATNDQHIAYNPLFLEEDNSPEQPAQDIGNPLGFLHGTSQADSSKEDIQKRELLELVAATFQPEDTIGPRQLLFMEGQAIAMIRRAYMDAGPNFPRVVMVPWADSGAFQLSFCETESPTTDAGQKYADLSAMLYSQRHGLLERSAFIVRWYNNRLYRLSSSTAESPTASVEEHADKNTLLSEILGELDVVVRWREDWDEEEEQQPEKPSEQAIDRAKQVVSELLGAVISEDKPLRTPFISYDQDGYITTVWRNGKHELYLEITEDEIEYVKVWGTNIDSEMDAGVPSEDNYLTLWEWLLDG